MCHVTQEAVHHLPLPLPGLSPGCSQRVARGGVEPPTFRFSVGRSYQLSYLAVACWTGVPHGRAEPYRSDPGPAKTVPGATSLMLIRVSGPHRLAAQDP